MSEIETLKFSIIIPVFNRPQEIHELLESLSVQSNKNFEVIIVEDGSEERCEEVIALFQNALKIKYFFKDNSGPGLSRNYGFLKASGNYCIFLDSDCVLPPGYFDIVYKHLDQEYVDAFGGPDEAHESFSQLQKAINYSMTSFFTTGGIRGGSEKMDKFYPRSFNMGYSRAVFNTTEGFAKMRFGEDIDMSIRILKNGFKTKLIKEAFVYHKRRTSLRQFFKQVFNSGIARINLHLRHPGSLKAVHFAPAIFTIGLLTLLFSFFFFTRLSLLPIAFYAFLIFLDASYQNRSIWVGLLAILTSFYQLVGYGTGFLTACWNRLLLKKEEYASFEKTFYE